MSQPKKKVSRSRRDKRRHASGNQLHPLTSTTCPNCSEPMRPHRVCVCGFYNDQEIFKVAEKAAE